MKQLMLLSMLLFLTQCYSPKWAGELSHAEAVAVPLRIANIFQKYPEGKMSLTAKSPGYSYNYDIGEKAAAYGNDTGFMTFEKVEIELMDKMPKGSVLTTITFEDQIGNKARVEQFDLMRLIPKYDTKGDMLYSEVLLEEFNRFGFSLRREHKEFEMEMTTPVKGETEIPSRMSITNNCLEATKWEMSLTAEDFSDFNDRLKSEQNLNQNKILAHCWFLLDAELYETLQAYKNPEIDQNYQLSYDSLNALAQSRVVDLASLRYPLGIDMEVKTLEIGHQSKRVLEPVDVEEFYKWQFGLFLNRKKNMTYSSILEEPVQIARFANQGFYNDQTPNVYDYGFLKYIDEVNISSINTPNTDCYAEITLSGEYAPYEVVIGNVDLAYPDEQKLAGMLFGYNTYPKSRRYNTAQSTAFYDADDAPEKMKPYVLMLDKKTGKWVNNQKKGVEKVYLSYEDSEPEVLHIYLLSYERVTPVWMAKVKLPKGTREAIRMRRKLYNY